MTQPTIQMTRPELQTELNDMYRCGSVAVCDSLEELLYRQGEIRAARIVARFKQELLKQ